jgi:hypothetical protein
MTASVTRSAFGPSGQPNIGGSQSRRASGLGKQKTTHLRKAFEEVARSWFALAEQAEWLDRHHTTRASDTRTDE